MPVQLRQRTRLEVGRQQDEHRRDQQDCHVLLVAAHLVEARQTHVGDHDAEHGHGQQTGLGLHPVGQHEHREHRGQQHRRLEKLRHMGAAEGLHEQPATTAAERQCHAHGLAKVEDHALERGLDAREDEILEHQHRQQRADRIVDDRLPLQIGGGTAVQHRLAQQRHDHRRPGDHQDRAGHQGNRPGQRTDVVRRRRGKHEVERGAERHQPLHTVGRLLQLVAAQVQSALEQDDGDAQADDCAQALLAEGLVRMDQAEDRPGQQSGHGEQDDGRELEAPGQPLGDDTQSDNQHEDITKTMFHLDFPVFRQGRRLSRRSSCCHVRPGHPPRPAPSRGYARDSRAG